ncbi:MAG: hypothetical protein QME64_07515 [bacterium]|nr:hypothetical protein [bacterium]
MANIQEKVTAELENISKVLVELEKVKDRPNKDTVVLVGLGGFLQNIYTGIENILKQLLSDKNIQIPETSTWHKDLLNLSVESNILTKQTADKLGQYLYFRHFFTHTYSFLIDESKLMPLIDNIPFVYSAFKREIDSFLEKLPIKVK